MLQQALYNPWASEFQTLSKPTTHMKQDIIELICGSREERLLANHTQELRSVGYLDSNSNPIGLGKHLIPLLLKTFKATNLIFDHGVEALQLEPDEEPGQNPYPIIQAFHEEVARTIEALSRDGYENAADLAYELILPHLNWVFCIHYTMLCAWARPFDVLVVNENAFSEDNPNQVKDALEAFLQVARKKNLKWSAKVAEKALYQLMGP